MTVANLSAQEVAELAQRAKAIRRHIVSMVTEAQSGHPGGSLSAADILTLLYFKVMNIDAAKADDAERDRFVLSKGHAAPVLYATLAEKGFFPVAELPSLRRINSRLQGHPSRKDLPGVEMSTGSLGQGLSIACGMAAGLKGSGARVYCVVGDGELAEGQIWEAAMAASAHRLDNLVCFLDMNGLQATGATRDRFPIDRFREKWAAFGWAVDEIDGHDIQQIRNALSRAQHNHVPTMIIAQTVKGKGIPCAENVAAFHNGAMTTKQYEETLQVLGGMKP